MNKNTFYKHHADGLVTLLSAPVSGIKQAVDVRGLSDDQLQQQVESKLFWNDRKRESEEWS